MRHVYFAQGGKSDPIKIGSSFCPEDRLKSLQGASPKVIRLLAKIPSDSNLELRLHAYFRETRVHREWFSPSQELKRFVARIAAKAEHERETVADEVLSSKKAIARRTPQKKEVLRIRADLSRPQNPKEKLLRQVVSQPYANQIVNGKRSPSLQTALSIYKAVGLKYGYLAGASTAEIRILMRRYRAQPQRNG